MIRLAAIIAAIVAVISVYSPLEAADRAESAEIDRMQSGAESAPSVIQVEFEALQAVLRRYRSLAASGGWPEVPSGPTIRPGDEGPRVAALAKRLAVTGYLKESEAIASLYDEALQSAVRDFQTRHGLDPDALVGRATLRALNVPMEQRIDQVRVNLERMRPFLDTGVQDYVLVNIPAFRATLVRGGQEVWSTKVIIGDKEDQTPEFHSELKSVVFNPTWSVPYSIASEEMLPRIVQDPDYFADNGYDVYNRDGAVVDPAGVDWSAYSEANFPFRLVQRPGPKNQLGRIKFMIPNPFSVCMHDTPARSLFANVNRALSHGCVRVDDPLTFAEFVLASEGVSRDEIDSQIESEETRTIALKRPLPFYTVYWTAESGESGAVQFYEDIYGRDARALDAL